MTSARRLTQSTSITAHAAAIAAVAYLDDKKAGNRRCLRARPRMRRSVEEIYESLGPTYFRRAYRMTYESFLKLHQKLQEGILHAVLIIGMMVFIQSYLMIIMTTRCLVVQEGVKEGV